MDKLQYGFEELGLLREPSEWGSGFWAWSCFSCIFVRYFLGEVHRLLGSIGECNPHASIWSDLNMNPT